MADPTAILAAQRIETEARIRALADDVATFIASASSTTGDDEHDPEGATIGFERAQAIGLLAQARAHLAEIEAAHLRADEGSYGTCVECGAPIGAARLEARPTATRCIGCADRH